jgi:hypothetical protein
MASVMPYRQDNNGVTMTKKINPKEFWKTFKDTPLKLFGRRLMPESTPPQSNQSAVVAIFCPRTATLCFDRVWSIPADATGCPDGIRFSMETDAELVAALFLHVFTRSKNDLENFTDVESLAAAVIRGDMEAIFGRKDFASTFSAALLGITLAGGFESAISSPLDGMSRVISENLQKTGRNVYPICASESRRDEEFRVGEYHVVIGSLHELEIVDEECLSWEQVQEFRQDSEVKADYRRFIHWLDSQMVGKTYQYVIDEIGIRYDTRARFGNMA